VLKHARTAGVAAAVGTALLLSGCGSSESDGGGDKAEHSASAAGNGSPGAGKGAGDLAGLWTATGGGEPVALSISGTTVGLIGKHACTGTVTGTEQITLQLKCTDGNTDRASGTVTPSADGRTMKVAWAGAGTETFTKSTEGNLPDGIPTKLPDGVPTDLPTDLEGPDSLTP
jgi:hypothetical protein